MRSSGRPNVRVSHTLCDGGDPLRASEPFRVPPRARAEKVTHRNMHIANGTPATQLPVSRWVKSSYSTVGNCVELAQLPNGSVAVRNSTDPEGPALVYTKAEIEAFLRGAAAGEFDAFAR